MTLRAGKFRYFLTGTWHPLRRQPYEIGSIFQTRRQPQGVTDATLISRGSILHQFPTRLDLMVATSEHLLEGIFAEFEELFAGDYDVWSHLKKLADVTWAQINSNTWTALAEIQAAAHWDPELADGIRTGKNRLYANVERALVSLAREAQIADPSILAPHVLLLSASMRGLFGDLYVHSC